METVSEHRKALIDEMKKKVLEAKAEFNKLSKEERKELRMCRKEFSKRVDETYYAKEEPIKADPFAEWAEIGIYVWDTRKAPSTIFEIEAAMELPFSKKLWLH
jgi:hypothetical protein